MKRKNTDKKRMIKITKQYETKAKKERNKKRFEKGSKEGKKKGKINY